VRRHFVSGLRDWGGSLYQDLQRTHDVPFEPKILRSLRRKFRSFPFLSLLNNLLYLTWFIRSMGVVRRRSNLEKFRASKTIGLLGY
jgi:hypothetical protein